MCATANNVNVYLSMHISNLETSMSDSELVVNKNKAHRKDKRERKAIIHIHQLTKHFF